MKPDAGLFTTPAAVIHEPVLLRLDAKTAAALRRPVTGSGGFQSAIRRIQAHLRGNSLVLGDHDVREIRTLATKYHGGGFQSRLKGVLVALDEFEHLAAEAGSNSAQPDAGAPRSNGSGNEHQSLPPDGRSSTISGGDASVIAIDEADRDRPIEGCLDDPSVRLSNVLRTNGFLQLGDLDGLAYEKFRRFKNCGRKTVDELRGLLAQVQDAHRETGVGEAGGSGVSGTRRQERVKGCVEVLDSLVSKLAGRSRDVVVRRFGSHARVVRVAAELGVVRERVRQIEEKFIASAERALTFAGVSSEPATEDNVIEFAELASTQVSPVQSEAFYVAVVRTLAIGGASYVDAESFYRKLLHSVVDEVSHDDDFVAGRLGPSKLIDMVYSLAPPLRELDRGYVEGWFRARLRLRNVDGVVVGKKPATGRIVVGLLRAAPTRVSLNVLLKQLEIKLALYEDRSHFDVPRLRQLLSRIPGVHALDQYNVTLRPDEPTLAQHWKDRAAKHVIAAGRPVSLVHFINENPSCPFDAYALASLLKGDERVTHVGRRLYAAAGFEQERSLRVARLISDALADSERPMTRRELLIYIRSHRDLVCGQVDNYFDKVVGLVTYTNDIVGLRPLTRSVMLSLLRSEACVLSLMRRRHREQPVSLDEMWLIDEEAPNLNATERQMLVDAARKWKQVSVGLRGGTVFFERKESQ